MVGNIEKYKRYRLSYRNKVIRESDAYQNVLSLKNNTSVQQVRPVYASFYEFQSGIVQVHKRLSITTRRVIIATGVHLNYRYYSRVEFKNEINAYVKVKMTKIFNF